MGLFGYEVETGLECDHYPGSTIVTTKEELHRLIESLDERACVEALDYVQWLLSDDDVLSQEELEEVRQGELEIAQGELVSLDELKRDLGV